MTPQNILRFLFAMILGFGINLVPRCRIKDAGNIVKFRPPGYVFSIVWPILYALFGLSWITSHKMIRKPYIDILFGLQAIMLTMWIVVYQCMSDKKGGIYVLLLNILLLTMIIIISVKKSQLMLVPLLVWLIFALLLNIFEVQG